MTTTNLTHKAPDNPEGFLGGIKLANGKELEVTTSAEDIYWFYQTGGYSVIKPKTKGGKSKGARNRGQKTVHRPGDMRENH